MQATKLPAYPILFTWMLCELTLFVTNSSFTLLCSSFLSEDYKKRITSADSLDQLWSNCKDFDNQSPMADEHKPVYKVSKVSI